MKRRTPQSLARRPHDFIKRVDLRKGFDDFFATPEEKIPDRVDRMIEIVPADDGKFRNVVQVIKDMPKDHRLAG